MGDIQLLLLDPPWPFNKRNNPKTRFGKGITGVYPQMKIPEIAAMPIKELLAPEALVVCWSTSFHLERAIYCMRQWKTPYVTTLFSWRKVAKGTGVSRGMPGFYTLNSVEPVLLGRCGKKSFKPQKMFKQDMPSPKLSLHSAKPVELYNRLEAMWPDLKKAELFARTRRDGWLAWGNEIDSDQELVDVLGLPLRYTKEEGV